MTNIAREVALGPSPVTVFDDETGIFIHGVISRFTFLEAESPPAGAKGGSEPSERA